jgi:hypothetical protein
VHALATSRIAAGAILSPRGLDDESCCIYSDAAARTFASSERGRAAVYDVLRARALDPRVRARHHG